MNEEGYDIAQICPNGHVSNSTVKWNPLHNQEFCDACGEKTFSTCPHCQSSIRGAYRTAGGTVCRYNAPSFCINCGRPFPWTERRIRAAKEMLAESGELSPEEVKETESSIEELAKNSPQGQVAATRMKRILSKVGKGTASAVRDILVDIASETAKKVIWPDK
jgi:hypothetical protein